jgi:hypothetical protein
MIAGGSRNDRKQLARVRETTPEVKGQANLCQGTKWIHRQCAALNGTEQRAGKERSGVGITVPIVAVPATQAVIAEEAFPEGVAVLGAAVADAKGIKGKFRRSR